MTRSSRRAASLSAAHSRSPIRTMIWIAIALVLLAAAYPQMRRLPETLNSVRGDQVRAALAFELGHLLGRSRRLPSTVPQKALRWVDEQLRERDWRVASVMRFVPLFPVSVFNFALGR